MMKLRSLAIVIALLAIFSQVKSDSTNEIMETALLHDFMKSMAQAKFGSMTCDQCLKLNKEMTEFFSAFFLGWKTIMTQVCKILALKTTFTEDGCMTMMGHYIPIVAKAFTRLFVTNKGFLCNFMLDVCEETTIEKIPVGPIIDQIYEGMPEKDEKPPTLRNTYTILQVNDIHIDLDYEPGSIANCKDGLMCCRANKTAKSEPPVLAGYWGATNGTCDIPTHTFDQFIEQIKQFKPDFIMWLGDNENHEIDTIPKEVNVESTKYLAEKLAQFAKDSRFIVSIGNHENSPPDTMDFNNKIQNEWFFKNLTEAFKPLLNEDEQKQISDKGYYTSVIKERNLRIISLFSAPGDSMNMYNLIRSYDVDGQISWLWNTLKTAEENKEDVFITIHIPIGNDFSISLWDEIACALVERYQNNIKAIFSAHTHMDHLTFIGKRTDREQVVKTQYIAPSLTTYTNMNPSFRIYEIDSDTNQIVDYTQYRLDLAKYNGLGPNVTLVWEPVYKFKEQYNVPDMSSKSMQTLKDKFWSDYTSMGPYMANFLTKKFNPEDILDKKLAVKLRCLLYSTSKQALQCLGVLAPFIATSTFPSMFVASLFPAFMKPKFR